MTTIGRFSQSSLPCQHVAGPVAGARKQQRQPAVRLLSNVAGEPTGRAKCLEQPERRTRASPSRTDFPRAERKTLTTMAKKPTCDPTKILEEIANDPEAPATARVQAAKALVAILKAANKKQDTPADVVTQRALKLLKGGKS